MRSPELESGSSEISRTPTDLHRVLLIDDDPSVLRLLAHLLRKAGYEVATAESVQEGWSLLESFPFDCIISDASMPELTGFDLLKRVRAHERWSRLPILMLTRNRTIEDVRRAVGLGVTEYVLKPVDPQLLLEKLDYCLLKSPRPGGRLYELPLSGDSARAVANIRGTVVSISESGLTLELESSIAEKEILQLDLPVFRDIGIPTPTLRLVSKDPAEPLLEQAARAGIQHRFSFVGVSEHELQKIRAWLQRESARRRKN